MGQKGSRKKGPLDGHSKPSSSVVGGDDDEDEDDDNFSVGLSRSLSSSHSTTDFSFGNEEYGDGDGLYSTSYTSALSTMSSRTSSPDGLPSGVIVPTLDSPVLMLDWQHLCQVPPSVFSSYSFLHTLVLNFNQLESLPSSPLLELRSLKELSLACNKLSYLPDTIAKLTTLEILNVGMNDLTGLPEHLFGDQEVENSRARGILRPDAEPVGLKCLVELRLEHNKLTAMPPLLHTLSNLKILSIGENHFLQGVPRPLPTSLERLSICGNGITLGSFEAESTTSSDDDEWLDSEEREREENLLELIRRGALTPRTRRRKLYNLSSAYNSSVTADASGEILSIDGTSLGGEDVASGSSAIVTSDDGSCCIVNTSTMSSGRDGSSPKIPKKRSKKRKKRSHSAYTGKARSPSTKQMLMEDDDATQHHRHHRHRHEVKRKESHRRRRKHTSNPSMRKHSGGEPRDGESRSKPRRSRSKTGMKRGDDISATSTAEESRHRHTHRHGSGGGGGGGVKPPGLPLRASVHGRSHHHLQRKRPATALRGERRKAHSAYTRRADDDHSNEEEERFTAVGGHQSERSSSKSKRNNIADADDDGSRAGSKARAWRRITSLYSKGKHSHSGEISRSTSPTTRTQISAAEGPSDGGDDGLKRPRSSSALRWKNDSSPRSGGDDGHDGARGQEDSDDDDDDEEHSHEADGPSAPIVSNEHDECPRKGSIDEVGETSFNQKGFSSSRNLFGRWTLRRRGPSDSAAPSNGSSSRGKRSKKTKQRKSSSHGEDHHCLDCGVAQSTKWYVHPSGTPSAWCKNCYSAALAKTCGNDDVDDSLGVIDESKADVDVAEEGYDGVDGRTRGDGDEARGREEKNDSAVDECIEEHQRSNGVKKKKKKTDEETCEKSPEDSEDVKKETGERKNKKIKKRGGPAGVEVTPPLDISSSKRMTRSNNRRKTVSSEGKSRHFTPVSAPNLRSKRNEFASAHPSRRITMESLTSSVACHDMLWIKKFKPGAPLVHLTHLDLCENRISSLPACMSKLKSLQSLSLSCNKLSQLPVGCCRAWRRTLRHLDLSYNSMSSIDTQIRQLKALTWLDFLGNPIPSLARLYLSSLLPRDKLKRIGKREPPSGGREKASRRSKDKQGTRHRRANHEDERRGNGKGAKDGKRAQDGKLETKKCGKEEEERREDECYKGKGGRGDERVERVGEVGRGGERMDEEELCSAAWEMRPECLLRFDDAVLQWGYPVPSEVLPNLYIGSVKAARNKHALRQLGVTRVVTVAAFYPFYPECFRYLRVDVDDRDSEDLMTHFPRCVDFITTARNRKESVLVHCRAGVSRSATVTIAYVMAAENLPFRDAFALVRSRRPCISPKVGFQQQLLDWERYLTLSRV